MPVSLYAGEEAYLLGQALKDLRARVVSSDMAGLGHQTVVKPSAQALAEVLGATSLGLLMGGTMLIEVHDFEPLSKAADDRDEKVLDYLKEILTAIVVDNAPRHVLFVSKKINRSVRFAKWLTTDKTLRLDLREFKPLAFWETDKAVQFLMQESQKKNINLQPQAAALLTGQMGVDLQALVNELEKLAVYTAGKPITPEAVQTLSNHNENVFAMLGDWLRQRHRAEIYTTLDEVLLRRHPVELFALIETWLGGLFQLRLWERLGVTQAEMAQRSKKHPFKIKMDLQEYAGVSLDRLEALKEKTLHYEWQSKNGSLNARLALEMLLGN